MLRRWTLIVTLGILTVSGFQSLLAQEAPANQDGWISLFDGKTLDGWRASEKEGSFTVKDGAIVVNGPRSHLFYMGTVENATFTDFELKAKVMTTQGSNSGIYFHTQFMPWGFPNKGHEAQINNSHSDPKRTGGLYNVSDVMEKLVNDDEWFDYYIKVEGKHILIQINGKTCVDYTEPADIDQNVGRKLSSGTFAIQAHDPKSLVYVKDIFVKPIKPAQ